MSTPFVPSAEQQQVIDHPSEPLRVVAGAGTGKTTTIVHRLRAVVAAGLEPEQAIGITFTNKAAEELADGLRRELPVHAAQGREVEVTTYHGFAYSILQEFGAAVGVERDSPIIGPGHVRQLLLECVAAEEFDSLDLTSPPSRVNEAATLAGQLARNLRTADDVKPDPAGAGDEVQARRAELLRVVSAFDRTKRRLGVIDYGDLILFAHRLVSTHPPLAEHIRDRYRLVLLDEYQDTDPAQRELLRCLFGDGFSVTAVGDVDQMIYEWRGASLANFTAFPIHFPTADGDPATTLPLTRNRRSGPRVLELAHRIRAEIHGREPENRLRCLQDAPDDVIRAGYFRTAVAEATWIAEEIRRLHDEEGVAWRDMAALFRKNRQITLVRDALDAEGVPFEVASLGGLLSVPDVADLHAWLRIIGRPDESPALLRILLGERYRLGFADVAPLAGWRRRQERDDADDDGPGWPLVEAIDRLDDVPDLDPEARARLTEFRDLYREFLRVAQGVSLVQLCRRILDGTETWAEVEAREPAAALTARLNLYRFLDLAEEWSPLRGRPSLEAFLGYLDILADERATDELDTARVGGENAVSLLTVHRAKGLEWDTVFLPAVSFGTFPAQSRKHDDPSRFPCSLPYDLRLDAAATPALLGTDLERTEELRERDRVQEWRAAYVAVTRAKRRLYLTGAHWYTTGTRPRPPSPLFEIASNMPEVEVFRMETDPGEPPERLAIPTLTGAPDPVFADGWAAELRAAMADPGILRAQAADQAPAYDDAMKQLRFTLDGLPRPPESSDEPAEPDVSVTALVALASCPKRFYWSEIEPMPRRRAPWLRRGIQVHRRIELHNRGRMALDEITDDLYDLAADEGEAVASVGNAFDTFRRSRFATTRPRFVETPIDLRFPSGRVRGRIDAIYEPEPGNWEIVDFKSGGPSEDPAAIVQLQAYAVAAADGAVSTDHPTQLRVAFVYLGGADMVEVGNDVDEAWLEQAHLRLDGLIQATTGDDFDPRPSPSCRRCDFLPICEPGRDFVASEP